MLHASFPHSVALMQLRFTSFVVINLREDLHLQECAHAGRTRKAPTDTSQGLDVGGDEEDRTPDLRIANATLSQLSYVP